MLNPYFDTTAFHRLPNLFAISPEPPDWDDLRAPGTRGLNLSLSLVPQQSAGDARCQRAIKT